MSADDTMTGGVIPPYPNLGPEPWPTGEGSGTYHLAGYLYTVLLAVVVATLVYRVRFLRGRSRRVAVAPPEAREASQDVVALASRLREGLARRFGPSWRAKTTEELTESDELAEALGPADLGRLLALLDASDRIKFAEGTARGAADQGGAEDWPSLARQIEARLADGASSSTMGK